MWLIIYHKNRVKTANNERPYPQIIFKMILSTYMYIQGKNHLLAIMKLYIQIDFGHKCNANLGGWLIGGEILAHWAGYAGSVEGGMDGSLEVKYWLIGQDMLAQWRGEWVAHWR